MSNMENSAPDSRTKSMYNLFTNESRLLTNKNNLTEISSEKVDSTTQNDEKNILENLSLKENTQINNQKDFPKSKNLQKKGIDIFTDKSKRIKFFRNLFKSITDNSTKNKKNDSNLKNAILFENSIYDTISTNHRNCKSNCNLKKNKNKTNSKRLSDKMVFKNNKNNNNNAISERKNLYNMKASIKTRGLSSSKKTQKNKQNKNFILNSIGEITDSTSYRTINCNSRAKGFFNTIENKNESKKMTLDKGNKNLYKDEKNYNNFDEENISDGLNCIEEILNLNNKIKLDENNDLLSDNLVLSTDSNLNENKFNINLIEIPEEDINLNENEDQIKIKKSNLSQSNLVFIEPENIDNEKNKSNKKNLNNKESNKIQRRSKKSTTSIDFHVMKRNSNKLINTPKNINKTEIVDNQFNFCSTELIEKFEKAVKDSINVIQEKKKYEKLINKLNSDIENLNKKKSDYEINFQKFKETELKKLEKLRNENDQKIEKQSNKGALEIQKLREIKQQLEKEMKFRDENNKTYINLLEKKLENSQMVNKDMEIKLQLYKNMNQNYSQDKDNISYNIELENTPKKLTKKFLKKSMDEKEINSSLNSIYNRNKKTSKLIASANKMIYSSIESESKSRSLSKKNQRTMVRNNKYSSSTSNVILKKRHINNLKSCTKADKSKKISELKDDKLNVEDLICLNNSSYNKIKKKANENMYKTFQNNFENSNLQTVKTSHLNNENTSKIKSKSKTKQKKIEKLNLDFNNQKKLNNNINIKTEFSSQSDLLSIVNDNDNENKKETKEKIENKKLKESKIISYINTQRKKNETNTKNKFTNKSNQSSNNINKKNKKKNNAIKKFEAIKSPNKNISKPIKKNNIPNTDNLSKNKNNINNTNTITITDFINDDENYDMQFPLKYHSPSSNNLQIINKSKIEDDKTIIEYENHKKTIIFSKIGLKKEIFPDGYQINYFKNKDIKQIYPDGKEVYFYSQNNSISTKLPNGTKILKFANGQIEKIAPDGTKSIKYEDGIMKNIYKDGYEEILYCDGSIEKKYKSGVIVVKYKDGIEDTKLLDGNMLRKYCDGRIVKMNKNGEIYE